MKYKIIAIIPTYNQKAAVCEAIDSILNQSIKVTKIIVIDNASDDGTFDLLSEKYKENPFIQLIRLSTNTGAVGGRNEGIRNATEYEYLLFFDHDMVAAPDMLEKLLEVFQDHQQAGIINPKIYYSDNPKIIWSAGTDINLASGKNIFRGGEDKGQYNTIVPVGIAPAVLLIKKSVIEAIGMFDPIYRHSYEDTDYCCRAKKANFLTYYTPWAVAYHKIPLNFDDSNIRLLKLTYLVARNRIIFMKKNSTNFLLFLFFIPVYFVYYAGLALKYKKYKAIVEYIKGTFSGLSTKVNRNYKIIS